VRAVHSRAVDVAPSGIDTRRKRERLSATRGFELHGLLPRSPQPHRCSEVSRRCELVPRRSGSSRADSQNVCDARETCCSAGSDAAAPVTPMRAASDRRPKCRARKPCRCGANVSAERIALVARLLQAPAVPQACCSTRRAALTADVASTGHTALGPAHEQTGIGTDGRSRGRGCSTSRRICTARRPVARQRGELRLVRRPHRARSRIAGGDRLTGGEAVLDGRMFLHYFRTTPDGRVLMGSGPARSDFADGWTGAHGGRCDGSAS